MRHSRYQYPISAVHTLRRRSGSREYSIIGIPDPGSKIIVPNNFLSGFYVHRNFNREQEQNSLSAIFPARVGDGKILPKLALVYYI